MNRVGRASRKPGPGPGTEPGPDRTRNTAHDDMHFFRYFDSFWTGLGCQRLKKVFKSGWFKSCQVYNSSFLAWWFWFLLDRFWLPKTDKGIKSGWFQSFQFYRSDLLVWWLWFHLDKFLAAKNWKSIQIWLIQTMSNLTFWFGGCDSFWTGLGCQSFKKYSHLTDSHHFNSNLLLILVWWLWFLLDRFWLPKSEKVLTFGRFQSFQFCVSAVLVWWIWFLLDTFWLRKIEKSIEIWLIQTMSNLTFWIGGCDSFWIGFRLPKFQKYSNLTDSHHFNSKPSIFFGLVSLIPCGQFLAAKEWKSIQIWLIPIISILCFCSSGLVNFPFGHVWAAGAWKSIQIWLIHIISILSFWSPSFGDSDSFWTGFGAQKLTK